MSGQIIYLDSSAIVKRYINEPGPEYIIDKADFISETLRMHKLNVLILVHLRADILKQAWKIVERHHVYQADALQIASAKIVNTSILHGIALEEGLNSKLI